MYEVFLNLLERRGLKASDVAKATGIHPSTFSDWKKGKSKPKQENLKKIADFFGVTLEYLMTGKEAEGTPYYLNEETRAAAQFLFEHPEHRVLFDASRKLTPEDIQAIVKIINRIGEND